MRKQRWFIAAAVAAVIVGAPIAWYLVSPLFITRTVNESFPAAQAAPPRVATPAASSNAPAPPAPPATAATAEPAPTTVAVATAPAMAPKTPEGMVERTPEVRAAQPAAPSAPVAVATGAFHNVVHQGSGKATIFRLSDGKRVLRFEDFQVLNGPDLYVWLSAAADANDSATILRNPYVELGRLKGNQGSQNYALPDGLDLSKYRSVTVWCRRFRVNFATAPLR